MAKITKEKITSCLKGSGLTLATLMGVIGGVVFGICLRQREGKYRPKSQETTLNIFTPQRNGRIEKSCTWPTLESFS